MTTSKSTTKASGNTAKPSAAPKPATSYISVLDIFRVLAGLALVSTVASYLVTHGESFVWGLAGEKRPWWTDPQALMRAWNGPLLLTNEQLREYDGSKEGLPIYLALNRTIYDVSSSPRVYGPGGAYSSLSAKDASRSYITTCFDPVDDLVPYFGGVEEIYVPLWLSKKPPKDELDTMAGGDSKKVLARGKDTEDLLEDIKRSLGFAKFRKMQRLAYEKAQERVRQQVKTWESMFEKKGYPIVGKVIGVNETDPSLWKNLKFCDAAKKQRPPLSESLSEAMDSVNKNKMKLDMTSDDDDEKKEKKKKKKKTTVKTKKAGKPKKAKKGAGEEREEEERPPIEEEEDKFAAHRTGHSNNPKATAKYEDMIPGGRFGLKPEELEELLKQQSEDEEVPPEAIQNILGGGSGTDEEHSEL